MISLTEYKQYLISVCHGPIDHYIAEIEKRKNIMNKRYSDEYLEKIISDTYSFIYDVLESETFKDGYFEKAIDDDTTSYIDLNLSGGAYSDTLFVDDNTGKIISRYLIRQVLGKDLMIYIKIEEIEDTSDENILSYYDRYYIYLQGFPKNLDNIKEDLFKKSKQLVKTVDSNQKRK